MKLILKIAGIALAFGLVSGAAYAGEAEKKMAVDLVNKAVDYYKANGKDKAFAEISNPKGQFVDKAHDLYIFAYDFDGVTVAHGYKAKWIGENRLNYKDPTGKPYIKDMIDLAKTKGEGWVDYKMSNPKSGKMDEKTSYVKRADNYFFGCGIYK